jgi:hypothetical protein
MSRIRNLFPRQRFFSLFSLSKISKNSNLRNFNLEHATANLGVVREYSDLNDENIIKTEIKKTCNKMLVFVRMKYALFFI